MKAYNRTYGILESYDIKDLFDHTPRKSLFFRKNQLDLNDKRKAKVKISYRLYRKLITTYFRIYFRDFYKKQNSLMYFPFGGLLHLAQQKWRGKTLFKWFWSHRPNKHLNKSTQIVRDRSSSGKNRTIKKNEELYKQKFDVTELQTLDSVFEKIISSNNTYVR